MTSIHLDHLSFRYSSAADVLSDVTLHLGPGWTGVVGGNGSGKTTLLRLLAGDLHATAGRVAVTPADALVVMCAQEVEEMGVGITAFAGSWQPAYVALRGRLGLDPEEVGRWDTLSPGERKRWQVGAALAADPDVLLLDEPTNHLDAAGREWLLDALGRFAGPGLVVSHDRAVLDDLTRKTLRLHRGEASLWNGSYAVAREVWTAAEQEYVDEYQRLRREQKKLDRRIADQQRATEAKRARFQRQMRTSDIKDIDARSAATTGVHRAGESAASRKLASAVGARDRVAAKVDQMTVVKELGRTLFVDWQPSPKAEIAVFHGDLVAGGATLAAGLSVVLRRTDRIWLRGPNGAGKTTLLETLRRSAALPPAKVLYLPQELTAAQVRAQLDELRGLPRRERGEVLALVAALGVDPDVLLVTERPTPGEARKLAMALGLGGSAWVLLLDEPTNHLDLPSVERLEAALAAYPGSMVLVTHDEAFGAALDLREWWIAGGGLQR